jgi:hypothetical protein
MRGLQWQLCILITLITLVTRTLADKCCKYTTSEHKTCVGSCCTTTRDVKCHFSVCDGCLCPYEEPESRNKDRSTSWSCDSENETGHDPEDAHPQADHDHGYRLRRDGRRGKAVHSTALHHQISTSAVHAPSRSLTGAPESPIMVSALAAQLAQTKSLNAALLTERGRRAPTKSYLFAPGAAADAHDLDALLALGVNGLAQLRTLDSRLGSYEDALFSPRARETDRTLLTRDAAEALDAQIEGVLLLLGPWIMEPAAGRVIEWLVRRFR